MFVIGTIQPAIAFLQSFGTVHCTNIRLLFTSDYSQVNKKSKFNTLVQQTTINQRLKFLIESLSTSVRAFSEQIGESTGNTNNYIGSRQLAPKHEYLAKVIKHYSNVNAHWLLTGEGMPFMEGTEETNSVSIKNTKGQVIGVNHGTATYQTLADCEKELIVAQQRVTDLTAELAKCEQEKEAVKRELEVTRELVKAKDEMLSLLRGGHNRPN